MDLRCGKVFDSSVDGSDCNYGRRDIERCENRAQMCWHKTMTSTFTLEIHRQAHERGQYPKLDCEAGSE